MEIGILLVLLVGSGFLAMVEMAVGASRNSRLAMCARDDASAGAVAAVLLFRQHPSRLLATTQLGITAMAMLAGAFGESLWVPRIAALLSDALPALGGVSHALALAMMVSLITFCSIVFGEVVPKRIALARPERIAMVTAAPMTLLLTIAHPFVWVMSKTADYVLDFFPFKESAEATAADEIRFLIESGRKEGALDTTEGEILGNVFRLDNRRVASIMTPAGDIACLDLTLPREANMKVIEERSVSRFLVCKGGVTNTLGFVEARELLRVLMSGNPLDFGKLSPKLPHFVPNTLSLIGLLEFYKSNQTQIALVVNEFGATEGLVTLSDLLGTVVGEVLSGATETPLALPRSDGSWLLDGMLPIDELKELLSLPPLPEEHLGNYHTLGGFMFSQIGRIPKKTESFEWGGWCFEVMDMERNRVDEVLAKRLEARPA